MKHVMLYEEFVEQHKQKNIFEEVVILFGSLMEQLNEVQFDESQELELLTIVDETNEEFNNLFDGLDESLEGELDEDKLQLLTKAITKAKSIVLNLKDKILKLAAKAKEAVGPAKERIKTQITKLKNILSKKQETVKHMGVKIKNLPKAEIA